MADFTKTQGTFLDWTALGDTVSDTPGLDSGTLTIPAGALETILNITVAHKDVNAAAANYVDVKVYIRAGANDEDWRLWSKTSAGGGTAVAEALDAESASAQAQIKVAATTDWDTGFGERLFLLDNTLVNSEVVTIIGWADADYYIAADNLTVTHAATTSILYGGLAEINVALPSGADYCKVVFANADDDANYAVRVDYVSTTDIE